jgi:chromosome segregation ATPase
MLQEVTVTGTH